MPPSPAATHHLPWFVAAPGETDLLMVVMAAVLIMAVLAIGILFLRLHSLPDRIAHTGKKVQLQIVCVLCLLSLFTNIHLFWVAALLLALIDIPDFGGAFGRIATSLERIAGLPLERRSPALPDTENEISDRKTAASTGDEPRPRSIKRKESLGA